jgi:hypothetical protein
MGFIDRGGDSKAGLDDHSYGKSGPWCTEPQEEMNATLANATRHCPVL